MDQTTDNRESLHRLEDRLGYRFRDRSLLAQALTHSSFANEMHQIQNGQNPSGQLLPHYERLEFLGDAVLELVVSDLLIKAFPEASEGELSRLRAGLVCTDRLARLAAKLELGSLIRLGRGEEASGGMNKSSILAAVVEAVIAAVYLDGGFEAAAELAGRWFNGLLEGTAGMELLDDYKTPLQEKVQAQLKTTPVYRVVEELGPDHMKVFEVELMVSGRLLSRGRGRSKKEAEQAAARQALLSGAFDE